MIAMKGTHRVDNDTGDGVAMAFRAGARLVDMEFTFGGTFNVLMKRYDFPSYNVAVAHGARLINARGERFMEKYDPLRLERSELSHVVAAFAKNFREAQTYLGILQILPLIPSMMLTLMPFKPQLWMYGVPLVGQQLVIAQLLRAEAVGLAPLGGCVRQQAAIRPNKYDKILVIYRVAQIIGSLVGLTQLRIRARELRLHGFQNRIVGKFFAFNSG